MTKAAVNLREWRLLPVISAPMPFQMALDEVLFRDQIDFYAGGEGAAPAPVLRFYYASEPWITVGYSHRNGRLKRGERYPVCRRLTGGGRVEHGNDIVFSLILHKDTDPSFKSVRISYWKIHEAVKRAFERLGKSPRFYRCDEKLPKGGDCFLHPISSDLALGGRKVAGGAQKRSQGFMLHQESIQLRPGTDAESLKAALKAGFEETYEARVVPSPWRPELFERAEKLAAEKYPKVGT